MQLRRLLGPHRPAKALESVMIFRLENALEEKTVSTSTRKLKKAKEEVRKANPGPVQELQVVPCLPDVGIKCASSERQVSVIVGMTAPASTETCSPVRQGRQAWEEQEHEEEKEER